MFTGIIQEIAVVEEINLQEKTKIFKLKSNLTKESKIGDSISVNGACMTITALHEKGFEFCSISESLIKTNLNLLEVGKKVNLELALRLNQGIDGHLVQGHIDTMGEVLNLSKNEENVVLKIKFPEEIAKYLAYKGSITINGVSLTISNLQSNTLEVSLIPHTLETTNLSLLEKNDKVNLEVDLIARYLENLLVQKDKEAKYFYLKERNLI